MITQGIALIRDQTHVMMRNVIQQDDHHNHCTIGTSSRYINLIVHESFRHINYHHLSKTNELV